MKIVIANWKMNPSDIRTADSLIKNVKRGVGNINEVKVIICPPFIYLPLVEKVIAKTRLHLGAQDLFWIDKGSFTSAISGAMLKHIGCDYVIVGHSERRLIFQDTNKIINNKMKAALRDGLKPVLCIGEKLKERRTGKAFSVLGKELKVGLKGISKEKIKKVLIAYEPIWAVGSKNPSPSEDIMQIVLSIRKVISRLYSKDIAQRIKILYGGSVNARNAKSIISTTKVDGLLIGRASLKSNQFNIIVRSL